MKKILSILSVLFLSAMLFAEPASVGITDSDVLNFIKNYSNIQKYVNSNTTEDQLNIILSENGINGDNRIEKYSIIAQGMAVITAEVEMDSESLAMLDALGLNPLKKLLDKIYSKDLTIIRKYSKQIIALVNEEDKEDVMASTPKTENNRSLLAGNARQKLLDQQMEDFKKQEEARNQKNNKRKPLEGSKYLSTVVKKLKESKKTGDCGFLYKKYDSKNAAYYKKESGKIPLFKANKAWYTNSNKTEQEALFSISLHTMTLRYINDDGEEVDDAIEFTVTSSEFYTAKKTSKDKYYSNGVGGEVVINTKEAGTIHIWYDDGNYSGKQNVKIWIEALGEVDFDELVFYLG